MSALPLERTPELRDALPLRRALHLAGEGLQRANIWINPRADGMSSALHYDGHDNLLLQLRGSKSVLLLPPEAHADLGYRPRTEHVYTFEQDNLALGRAFPSHVPASDDERREPVRSLTTTALSAS